MAKVETNTCDTPGCDRVAHGSCVLCQKDGCKEHLTGSFKVTFLAEGFDFIGTEMMWGGGGGGGGGVNPIPIGGLMPIKTVAPAVAGPDGPGVVHAVSACSRCTLIASAPGIDRAAIEKALAESFDKILEELRVAYATAALAGPQVPSGPAPYVGATNASVANALAAYGRLHGMSPSIPPIPATQSTHVVAASKWWQRKK